MLSLGAGPGALDGAEADLHSALRIAREQEAPSLEQRAARDLARLWGKQGKRAAGGRCCVRMSGN